MFGSLPKWVAIVLSPWDQFSFKTSAIVLCPVVRQGGVIKVRPWVDVVRL